MTFAQLRAARPGAWLQICAGLRAAADRLADRAEETARCTGQLRRGWRGTAGTAAVGHLDRLRRTVVGLAATVVGVDQAVAEYAAGIARAQASLADLIAELRHVGLRVSGDGAVHGGDDPAPARDGAARIEAVLRLADATQDDATRRLHALLPALVPGPGAPSRPAADTIPVAGTAPAAVRDWWRGLPDAERHWLLAHHPARIGALDGVPAAVRDQINRVRLGDTQGFDALRGRLATDEPGRAYLLSFDPAAGRAVVATGDPDRADNVVTYVPGTSESLATLGVLLERADQVTARAAALTETTSVVVWLGYDPPADLRAAAATGPAERAGPDLARFADGLRATHAGPVHHTVLGHSYGSLVVGMTAHEAPLAADDLIFVGSPGVGVKHADELGMPAGHVWSSTAVGDPITALRAASGIRDPFVFGQTGPADAQWFGTDPSSAGFGARVFAADPGDPRRPVEVHSAYFTDGNRALDTIARIARGDTAQVR